MDKLKENMLPRADDGKSSPILDHPPKTNFTRGKEIKSSPIGRVNRGVGNLADM